MGCTQALSTSSIPEPKPIEKQRRPFKNFLTAVSMHKVQDKSFLRQNCIKNSKQNIGASPKSKLDQYESGASPKSKLDQYESGASPKSKLVQYESNSGPQNDHPTFEINKASSVLNEASSRLAEKQDPKPIEPEAIRERVKSPLPCQSFLSTFNFLSKVPDSLIYSQSCLKEESELGTE